MFLTKGLKDSNLLRSEPWLPRGCLQSVGADFSDLQFLSSVHWWVTDRHRCHDPERKMNCLESLRTSCNIRKGRGNLGKTLSTESHFQVRAVKQNVQI